MQGAREVIMALRDDKFSFCSCELEGFRLVGFVGSSFGTGNRSRWFSIELL